MAEWHAHVWKALDAPKASFHFALTPDCEGARLQAERPDYDWRYLFDVAYPADSPLVRRFREEGFLLVWWHDALRNMVRLAEDSMRNEPENPRWKEVLATLDADVERTFDRSAPLYLFRYRHDGYEFFVISPDEDAHRLCAFPRVSPPVDALGRIPRITLPPDVEAWVANYGFHGVRSADQEWPWARQIKLPPYRPRSMSAPGLPRPSLLPSPDDPERFRPKR